MTRPSTPRSSRFASSPVTFLVILLAIGAIALSAFNTVHILSVQFASPPENTHGEAGKVFYAKMAMAGEAPFTTAQKPPFYPAVHGPLMHSTVGVIGRALDADVLQLYFIGRGISLLATLGALILAGVLAWRLKAHWLAALVGLLLFFGPTQMVRHSISYRPDNWNLLLSVLACYLVAAHGRRWWALALACVLPVIAFYIKAPGLGIAGAVVLALSAQRQWVAGLVCGVMSAVLMVGSFFAVNWLSGGLFLQGLHEGMDVPFSLAFPYHILAYNYPMWLALLLPVLLIGRPWSRDTPEQTASADDTGEHKPEEDRVGRTRRTVLAFWGVSLLVAIAAATRHGANNYYFIAPYTYGTILLVGLASVAIRYWRTQTHVTQAAMLGLLLLLGMTQVVEAEHGIGGSSKVGPRRS